MRRACGTDRRPVFHRGKQVATVERHNDAMLMRVLARFDRLRERQAGQARRWHAARSDLKTSALLDEAGERARRLSAEAACDSKAGDERNDCRNVSRSMRQASGHRQSTF